MECPHCHQKAIRFLTWAKGTNAFKTECMNCRTPLKANFVVWLGIFMMFFLLIVSIIVVIEIKDRYELSWWVNELVNLIPVPFVWFSGYVTWKHGGYRVATR